MEPETGHPEKFKNLLDLIARLRSPAGGCPWDIKQRSRDVGRYLIEESYEVLDALESGRDESIREELGDLLFQILFLARIGEEEGRFDIGGVIDSVTEKMVRRHPHIFGDAVVSGAEEVKANWDRIKAEQEGKGKGQSLMDSVPRSMPPLLKAEKITRQAAKVGFDWDSAEAVLSKVEEEIREFRESLDRGKREDVEAEIGDMLFSVVNLARFLEISADGALGAANRKFLSRFSFIEKTLKGQGRTLQDAGLEEMDALWELHKKIEAGETT